MTLSTGIEIPPGISGAPEEPELLLVFDVWLQQYVCTKSTLNHWIVAGMKRGQKIQSLSAMDVTSGPDSRETPEETYLGTWLFGDFMP